MLSRERKRIIALVAVFAMLAGTAAALFTSGTPGVGPQTTAPATR